MKIFYFLAAVLVACYFAPCDGHFLRHANSRLPGLATLAIDANIHHTVSVSLPWSYVNNASVVAVSAVALLVAAVASLLWRDVIQERKQLAASAKATAGEDSFNHVKSIRRRSIAHRASQEDLASLSASEERPASLLGDCIGALMAFSVELVNCITIGLILQGNWPRAYLDVLFRHATYGFLVTQLFTSLISQFSGVLAPVGFECLGVMLVVRKIVVSEMHERSIDSQVMTYLACSTIVTMISAVLLGIMVVPRFSRILNVFPNCLRTGVFAATGFGIFLLGFQAFQLDPVGIESWTNWENILKWLPAYFLGMTLWFFDQYHWNKWLFLIFVVVVSGGVHCYLKWWQVSLEQAADDGWLLGQVAGSHFYEYYVFLYQGFGSIDWAVVWACSDRLLAAAFVGPMLNVAINVLLLESLYKTNCNYAREFLAQSLGLAAAAAIGGYNSYLAVGDTNTLRQAGGRTNRAAAILCGLLLLVCIVPPFLPAVTSVMPTHLIAAMCVYGGFWMAKGSLVDNYACFSGKEYVLVVLTLMLCVCFTILDGLKVGFVIMTLLYMVRGANDDYLRYLLSLRECRSVRTFAPCEEKWLRDHGNKVVVAAIDIQLISVFTDPAHIWRQMQFRVTASSALALAVDFDGVQRIDATSIQTFVKMLTNIKPCSVLIANMPNSDFDEHAVLRRNLEDQNVEATLFLDEKGSKEHRRKDMLVCAEQLLISTMSVRRRVLMPLFGLLNLEIQSWPLHSRCMAKIRVMHSVLQLYLLRADCQTSKNPRSFYHFALRGLCSFVSLQRGDVLLREGEKVQELFVLAGGMVLAKEAGTVVAEHAVMGELLGASGLFASSAVQLEASSRALVLRVDLRSIQEEAELCPHAVLVLQLLLQEVARSQETKMIRRIQQLSSHATDAGESRH